MLIVTCPDCQCFFSLKRLPDLGVCCPNCGAAQKMNSTSSIEALMQSEIRIVPEDAKVNITFEL